MYMYHVCCCYESLNKLHERLDCFFTPRCFDGKIYVKNIFIITCTMHTFHYNNIAQCFDLLVFFRRLQFFFNCLQFFFRHLQFSFRHLERYSSSSSGTYNSSSGTYNSSSGTYNSPSGTQNGTVVVSPLKRPTINAEIFVGD